MTTSSGEFGWKFGIGEVRKDVNLIDFVKNFPTTICFRKSVSMQPRSSLLKFIYYPSWDFIFADPPRGRAWARWAPSRGRANSRASVLIFLSVLEARSSSNALTPISRFTASKFSKWNIKMPDLVAAESLGSVVRCMSYDKLCGCQKRNAETYFFSYFSGVIHPIRKKGNKEEILSKKKKGRK